MLKRNEFYDINQFPSEHGMLVFGISMSRIGNSQSPAACMRHLESLYHKIKRTEGVGLTTLYADYLYMLTEKDPPAKARERYLGQMFAHKFGIERAVEKSALYVRKAFSFMTWGELLLQTREYPLAMQRARELMKSDARLRAFVRADAMAVAERPLRQHQQFILEESVLFYLIAKGKASFPNEFIQHRQDWVLLCYPGGPLRTETYLFQKDFLGYRNPRNVYQNHYYDLVAKKLYDFSRIDIETFRWDA